MRILALLLLALGLTIAPTARAFVPLRSSGGTDYSWNLDSTSLDNIVGGKVTYYVGDLTTDSTATDPKAAVVAGIEVWQQVEDTRIAFEEDRSRPATRHKSGDHINVVAWVSGELGPFTLATTYPTQSGGKITDADMLINDDDYDQDDLPMWVWSDSTPASGTSNHSPADIMSVVVHEWGHAIGLDHVTTASATMYYAFPLGAIYYRTLHSDDEAAVAAIYPAASFDDSRGSIRGTVDVLGRSNDRGVEVFAIDAQTGEVAVSALTEPDGTYAIRGLLPGIYRIVAAPFTPLSTLNSYWSSTSTSFLAAPLTETGSSPGETVTTVLDAGDDLTGHNLTVENRDTPLEPDDATGQATRIVLGDSVAARIETPDDRDYYRLTGVEGRTVTILVHSTQIGGDLDPKVEILAPNGTDVLTGNGDIRSPAEYRTTIEGPDQDCRLVYQFDLDSDYFVRVSAQTSFFSTDSPVYVLTVTGGPPDPEVSLYEADPPSIDADGASKSTVRVVPRNRFGGVIHEATVRLENGGVGTLGPVSQQGDGSWTATFTAADSPGAAPIDVTITASDGVATVPAAVTVYCVGPPSPTTSEISAAPDRIPFDGASTSTVTATPRDDLGQPLGPGRAVVLALTGPGTLGPVEDRGDGTYEAVLTSPTEESDAEVTLVEVAGVPVGISVTVHFGFDLEDVCREVRDAVRAIAEEPSTPAKSVKKLGSAAAQLDAALDKIAIGEVTGALSQVKKATKSLEKAQKKGGAEIDLAPYMTELALASKQSAEEEILTVQPADDRARNKLAKAEAKVAKGDAALADGKYSKAVKCYRSGYRKAAKL